MTSSSENGTHGGGVDVATHPPEIVVRTDTEHTDTDVETVYSSDDHHRATAPPNGNREPPRRSTISALSDGGGGGHGGGGGGGYGATDDIDDDMHRHNRRSIAASLSTEMLHTAERRKSTGTNASTAALCASVLCMFYLLFSPFPYSGFMAVHLVPTLTHDSVGTYAGLLSSSFMVGRALSSFPWGRAADIYGRRFVLVVSLINSGICSVLFGVSPSYEWALTVRFLMGLGNGTMLVARTLVSELARGDKDAEAKGMGLVMSMVGYGMLISPTLGGLLSDPMKQYPDARWFGGGTFDAFLTQFPFVLPNIIGAVLCVVCAIFVMLTIEETLPEERRRGARHFLPDVGRRLMGVPMGMWGRLRATCAKGGKGKTKGNSGGEYEPLRTSILRASTYRTSIVSTAGIGGCGSDHRQNGEGRGTADVDDDDLRTLESQDCAELSAMLSSRSSRASFSAAMRRPSTRSSMILGGRPSIVRKSILESLPDNDQGNDSIDKDAAADQQQSTENVVRAILSNKSTRHHLLSYWINGLVSVMCTEAFPLFCMSKEGGLGLDEKSIGGISAGAGVLFCICQYFIFAFCMKKFGLYRTAAYGCFWSCVPVVLYPLSMLLRGTPWVMFAFLTVLMAVTMIFNSVFYAAITIGTNRTVDSTQRATLNGLSSIGSSVGRGLGPIFAGALVAFSMSGGAFSPRYGSVVIYSVLTACGAVAFAATRSLSEDEEEEAGDDDDFEKGRQQERNETGT